MLFYAIAMLCVKGESWHMLRRLALLQSKAKPEHVQTVVALIAAEANAAQPAAEDGGTWLSVALLEKEPYDC